MTLGNMKRPLVTARSSDRAGIQARLASAHRNLQGRDVKNTFLSFACKVYRVDGLVIQYGPVVMRSPVREASHRSLAIVRGYSDVNTVAAHGRQYDTSVNA